MNCWRNGGGCASPEVRGPNKGGSSRFALITPAGVNLTMMGSIFPVNWLCPLTTLEDFTVAQILTVPPRTVRQTFLDFELVSDLESLAADVAILGAPYSDPYSIDQVTNDQTNAPTAIRRASLRSSGGLERWDFDLGGPIFDGKSIRAVDCGDVPGDARDLTAHYKLAEQAARLINAKGTLLITLGGDHGVPIPILRGLDAHGPITLVQIDAHLDWIDNRNGVREGYSSPIRRASEMDHIGEIFQIGLRCQGSARNEEVTAARTYGSHLITDMELQGPGN